MSYYYYYHRTMMNRKKSIQTLFVKRMMNTKEKDNTNKQKESSGDTW